MNISNKNNTSFKATPLYSLNLLKRTERGPEIISATVSRLLPLEDGDSKIIGEIAQTWKNSSVKSLYLDFFKDGANCTLSDSSFANKAEWDVLLMETAGTEPIGQRALSLARTKIYDDIYELSYLQTNPEHQYPSSICRLVGEKENPKRIKDIGRLMFGAVIAEANRLQVNDLYFFSVADAFYRKITKDAKTALSGSQSSFHIESANFEKYIRFCKEKFNFSKINEN